MMRIIRIQYVPNELSRIRRVKCDETKPECNMCISTGRACDGYVIKPRKKRSDAAIVKEPSLTPEIVKEPSPTPEIGVSELRALRFFYQKTAPSLSSYFDADFWTYLVMQMSYAEPAIRHAIIALGALHEQREQEVKMLPNLPSVHNVDPRKAPSSEATKPDDRNNRFALAQYNKAIGHLSKRLDSNTSVEVALLACILFVCVEFLRGDAQPAISHFTSGMTIALAYFHTNSSHTAAATLERIKEYMLPFFNRIELLSALFGNDPQWEYPVKTIEAVPDEFHSMKEARDSIVHLCNLNIRFIRVLKDRRYDRLISPEHYARQSELLRQLDIWSSALDTILFSDKITERDLDAAKTLRIHLIIAQLWLKSATMPEECANDQWTTEFDAAVSLAEDIHSIHGTEEQQANADYSTFLFDMEVISPLYYVALRCRHPQVRRRAIQVLKKSRRREGLWDSEMAAAIAERDMEIEEANLSAFDGSELPPEEVRIHDIHILSEAGILVKKHDLIFYGKPNGIDEPWQIWKEQLVLP